MDEFCNDIFLPLFLEFHIQLIDAEAKVLYKTLFNDEVRMLYVFSNRLTASQCLKHPWLLEQDIGHEVTNKVYKGYLISKLVALDIVKNKTQTVSSSTQMAEMWSCHQSYVKVNTEKHIMSHTQYFGTQDVRNIGQEKISKIECSRDIRSSER